ncbi:MAG TPA: DinB family protein [Pyrinomonadaceae bacterium]|jgi:tetrahydromethanopterin S-methyltransferase subunit B
MQQTTTDAHTAAAATDASPPLVAELDDYRRQVEAVKADVADLLKGLTDVQFNWRSAPGRWSIGECLAHLNLTGQVYLRVIDRGIEQGRTGKLMSAGPYRHGWFGKFFLRKSEPPVKTIKIKAPKIIVPVAEHLIAVVAPAFMSLQEQLLRRLREANGLDLGRIKITSPFIKFIRFDLGHSIAITIAHERRHLWQAREVRNDPNFPTT